MGKLANGLSYFIERGGRPGDRIQFSLVVRVGDAQALPGEQQVAHVVEHIVIAKLRDAQTKGSIWDRASRFGGVRGTDVNAGTGLDTTRYSIRMPAGEPEALAAALDILHDWIDPGTITDEEIDRERTVVIEETRRASPSAAHVLERQARTLFGGLPFIDYPRDQPGTLSARPATIRALHRDWYTPGKMAVVIVGDVDPDAILAAITVHLGAISAGAASPPPVDVRAHALRGGNYVPLTDPEQSETRLEITQKYRMPPPGSLDQAQDAAVTRIAQRLLTDAFGNLGQRYGASVRSGGIGSTYHDDLGVEIMTVNANLRPGSTRSGLIDVLRLLATVRRDGFSDADIGRARRDALAEMAADTPSASDIAMRWEGYFARKGFSPTVAEIRAAIAGITPAAFNVALAKRLDPAGRDIFAIHPQSAGATVPTAKELSRLIADADRTPPVRLSLPVVKAPVLDPLVPSAAPTPPGVVEAGGYIRWTLPRSGATLIFRHTDMPQVALVMLRRGGASRYDPARAPAALAAASAVMGSGLGGLDIFELGRFFKARGVSVRPFITPSREGLAASGPIEQWPLIVSLARAQLLRPQCDAAAFRDHVAESAEAANRADDDTAFYPVLRAALGGIGSPDAAALARLKLSRLCRQYTQMLSDTRGMTIVVEGKLLPDAVYAVIGGALDIPARGWVPPIHVRPLIETKAGRETVQRGRGNSASVILIIQLSANGGDEQPGHLAAWILGQRIQQRLRDVEKGVYSAGTSFVVQDSPTRMSLSISFDGDPANADRLVAAAKDEVARFRSRGFTVAELAAARRGQRQRVAPDDIAETWISRGTLAPLPVVTHAEVDDWVVRYVDPMRLREFVRIPARP